MCRGRLVARGGLLAAVAAGEGRGSLPLSSAQRDALGVKPGRFGVFLRQTRIPPGLQERDHHQLTGLVWDEAARGIATVTNLALQGFKLLSENNRR